MRTTGDIHIIAGGPDQLVEVHNVLRAEGSVVEGNANVYTREYQLFGVEDARELRDRSALRGGEGGRVFIIVASTVTNEAQNALLKTFEEPVEGTRFFLIVPSPYTLLPTLRSRAHIHIPVRNDTNDLVDVKAFLAAPVAKRLDMLKPLLEKDENEKRNVGAVVEFLASLERCLSERKDQASVHAVYRARKYMGDKGALLKPLLEQVALLAARV